MFQRSGKAWRTALLIATLAGTLATGTARAEDLVWATGRVLDASGRPMIGATVAVYDDSNKVVDYAKTDQNGEYALALPRKVLHLDKKGKGFFTQVFGTITRFIGDTAGFVANPLRAGVRAVTSSQAANATDPLTRGGIAAGGAAADQVLSLFAPRRGPVRQEEERKQPGALVIKAVAPGTKDVISIGRVYWVQREVFRAGGKETKTLAAWIDPIQLAPTRSEKPSLILPDYLHFTEARLEPSLAEPGQKVHIFVRLPSPPEPKIYPVVVARNTRTGQKWQMAPVGPDEYETTIEIDKRFPKDDQVISVVAYASQDTVPGRRDEVERAIEGSGMWNANTPFRYNPLIVVSRNRADLILTVIAPDKKRR